MKNVLVTGSSGFVGHHLFNELHRLHPDWNVYGCSRKAKRRFKPINPKGLFEEFRCELSNPQEASDLLFCTQPDIIFHLAATAVVKEDAYNPTAISLNNYNSTHNLLVACKEGTRFVFASSVLIRGDIPSNDHYYDRYSPSSIYGVTKAASEMLIQTYQKQGKISAAILRLTANVGTGSTHGILHDFVRKIKDDNPVFPIIGDKPGSTKPYTYIKDTIDAFNHFGFHKKDFNIVNICPNNSISNEKMAEILMEVTGIKKPIEWLGEKANWKGDNREIRCYNDKARIDGWEPKFRTSEDAVRQAIRDIFYGI